MFDCIRSASKNREELLANENTLKARSNSFNREKIKLISVIVFTIILTLGSLASLVCGFLFKAPLLTKLALSGMFVMFLAHTISHLSLLCEGNNDNSTLVNNPSVYIHNSMNIESEPVNIWIIDLN